MQFWSDIPHEYTNNLYKRGLALARTSFLWMPVQFPRGLKGERRNFLGRDENHHLFYCTFTALIHKSLIMNGAGEGNRTLVSALGRPRSTIEPHPLPRLCRSRATSSLRLPLVLADCRRAGNWFEHSQIYYHAGKVDGGARREARNRRRIRIQATVSRPPIATRSRSVISSHRFGSAIFAPSSSLT